MSSPGQPSPNPSPESPAGPQGSAGAATSGQPPIGSSPATQPVPNRGLQAAALAQLGIVNKILERVLPMLGSGSDAGRDVLDALRKLSKHIPPNSVSPGVEASALNNVQNQNRQNIMQMMAAKSAAPAGGGAPGGAPPQIAQMMRPQGSA